MEGTSSDDEKPAQVIGETAAESFESDENYNLMIKVELSFIENTINMKTEPNLIKDCQNSQTKTYVGHEYNGNDKTKSSQKVNDKPIFQCELCPYTAKKKYQLQRHFVYSHEKGSRANVCPICDKKYYNSDGLKIHIRGHTGERPFLCTTCGKSFKRKSDLKEHFDFYHTKGGLYICPICGIQITSLSGIRLHKSSHSNSNKKCEVCSKDFLNEWNLKQHMKLSHSGEAAYQFQCDKCSKCFNRSNSLKRHSFIHSVSKDFSCSVCPKSFKSPHALKNHMKVHEDPDYVCNHCGKQFFLLGNLKAHERVHSGEKPYVCELCEKAFVQKGNLKLHQRKCSQQICQKKSKAYLKEKISQK